MLNKSINHRRTRKHTEIQAIYVAADDDDDDDPWLLRRCDAIRLDRRTGSEIFRSSLSLSSGVSSTAVLFSGRLSMYALMFTLQSQPHDKISGRFGCQATSRTISE